jgi:hypothetical protein
VSYIFLTPVTLHLATNGQLVCGINDFEAESSYPYVPRISPHEGDWRASPPSRLYGAIRPSASAVPGSGRLQADTSRFPKRWTVERHPYNLWTFSSYSACSYLYSPSFEPKRLAVACLTHLVRSRERAALCLRTRVQPAVVDNCRVTTIVDGPEVLTAPEGIAEVGEGLGSKARG